MTKEQISALMCKHAEKEKRKWTSIPDGDHAGEQASRNGAALLAELKN